MITQRRAAQKQLIKSPIITHPPKCPYYHSPHGVIIVEAHLLQLTAAVELIVSHVRGLTHVLHVGPQKHLTQLHKVTVVLILHCRGPGGQRD